MDFSARDKRFFLLFLKKLCSFAENLKKINYAGNQSFLWNHYNNVSS